MAKILILMSLLSILGCGRPAAAPQPGKPERRLTSIEYGGTHGYHSHSNIDYKAERMKDGRTRVTVMVGNDRDRVFVEDGSVMDTLEALVMEYKMYKYDKTYTPKFDILDGDSWHLYQHFSDGSSASCGGYEATPPGKGAEGLAKIAGYLSRWLDREPAEDVALTAFRYELHNEEGTEVYWFKKDPYHNAIYFRKMGSLEGCNYYCGDPELLVRMARAMRWHHLGSYTGEKLEKENTSRPRWIVVAEYENGQKFEIMDYLDRPEEGDEWNRREVPSISEWGIRSDVEHFFGQEIERIGNLPPEELGDHSVTTYDAKGKPQRTINYDGHGNVLNGRDYNDPMKDF